MYEGHSRTRVLATLVKREFIEHRVLFLYAPLAAVMTALAWFGLWLLSEAAVLQGQYQLAFERWLQEGTLELPVRNPDFAGIVMYSRYARSEEALLLLFWLSMAYYALSNLYEQRKDRSVLFWHSLPVSDTQTIASKLLAGPVLGYLVYLLCLAALDLGMHGLAWLHAMFTDNVLFDSYLRNTTLFAGVGRQLVRMPLTVLWYLPVFGWLLFASAYAKRAPFAWATGPWVVLIITELAFNDRSWLLDRILERLVPIEAVLARSAGTYTVGAFAPLPLIASVVLGFVFLAAAVRCNRADAS